MEQGNTLDWDEKDLKMGRSIVRQGTVFRVSFNSAEGFSNWSFVAIFSPHDSGIVVSRSQAQV